MNNNHFIKTVTAMTDDEYTMFRWETGCKFVEEFDPKNAAEMKRLDAYWMWFNRHHERTDIRFSKIIGTRKLLGMNPKSAKKLYQEFHERYMVIGYRKDSYISFSTTINNKTRNHASKVQTHIRKDARRRKSCA